MVLVVLYAGVGIYLGVLASGLIHKAWWAKIDPYTRSNVRMAVSILAVGGIALAIYHAHLYSEFRQGPPDYSKAAAPLTSDGSGAESSEREPPAP
ncbi:MAG: hypothetical protein RIF32_01615 [Leptospirales bacterium]